MTFEEAHLASQLLLWQMELVIQVQVHTGEG